MCQLLGLLGGCPEERRPFQSVWGRGQHAIGHDHGRRPLADLTDIQADPEGLVVEGEGGGR
jgi:hypothetical protein